MIGSFRVVKVSYVLLQVMSIRRTFHKRKYSRYLELLVAGDIHEKIHAVLADAVSGSLSGLSNSAVPPAAVLRMDRPGVASWTRRGRTGSVDNWDRFISAISHTKRHDKLAAQLVTLYYRTDSFFEGVSAIHNLQYMFLSLCSTQLLHNTN